MSDAVLAALIVGIFNLAGIFVSRLMSHGEHKKTASDVKDIKKALNGEKTADS